MDILDDMGVSKLSAKVFFFLKSTPLIWKTSVLYKQLINILETAVFDTFYVINIFQMSI